MPGKAKPSNEAAAGSARAVTSTSDGHKETMPADPHEIVNTRVFAATPERLFAAFRNPQQLAQWWGPRGFTSTFHEFDLKPGGRWRFVMHGPDGADYPNENEFVEVSPPARIVFDHPDPQHRFRMTMTFTGRDGKTQLTWRMRFDSLADASRLREFLAAANEQNFDRLAAHLAALVEK